MTKPANIRINPERLKQRRQFLRVARTGSKWVTKGVVLQAAPQIETDSTDTPRVGFTVTKKVGNAVIRNRAKRRLRAAAQILMPEHGRAAIDYVLIGRHTTPTRPWALLLKDLETALGRIQIDDTPPIDRQPKGERPARR